MLTRNVEPRPGSVSTLTLPPSSSTRRLTMWRPSPTPPNRRVEEPSAWRNISGRSAAAMPMPVSRTSNVSRPLARAAVTSTLPAGVNLRALPTRFFKMVFSLTPSLGTGWMPRAAAAPCQPRRALCIVARRMAAYSVGIDVGGTFTDCFVTDGVHGWRGKAPTTPRAPLCGLLAALEDAAAAIGVPLARALGDAVHLGLGTTVVTNCLAELAGAPTGLLVTEGFGDLWPMARGHRLGVGGMSRPLPTLVPRRRIAEVRERVDREGAVLVPLDESGVVSALERLVGEDGVESLAICLLWSFRNPAHERRVAAIVRERYPELPVSCSADLVPVIREYERMTATVLSAYTTRSCAAFLDELEARLAAAGLRVPVAVMQSSGGTLAPAAARARPILLAQSGPVAGVAAAEALPPALGAREVIQGALGRPRPARARRGPRRRRRGARHVPACARGDAARGSRAPRRARARPPALRLPLLRWLWPALRRADGEGAGARPGDRAGAGRRLLGR